jgi:hypothetical protein
MYADGSVEAELKNAQAEPFLVGECVQEWKAELTHKAGKITIECGVTLDLDSKNSYDRITLTPCGARPRLPVRAEIESVDNTMGDNLDNFVDTFVDTFQDQAVADVANDDNLQSFEDDLAVADFNDDTNFVVDTADQAVADVANDDNFVDTFQDQAVADVANDDNVFAFADTNTEDALLSFDQEDNLDQAIMDFSEEDLFVGDLNDQAVMDAFNDEFH